MQLNFTKMHGLGNDFMVVDGITQRFRLTTELVTQWSNRHTGIGFDQLLIVEPPSDPAMDFRYRIFNADGSEVENCGNGARCFARFVRDQRLTRKHTLHVETTGGPLTLHVTKDNLVRVDMGRPRFEPSTLPFQADEDALVHSLALEHPVEGIQTVSLSVVSMGNPHAVIQVDAVETAPVATLGPALENHPRFPKRVNVGFMQIETRSRIRLRVFERGTGETQACGTGACAAVATGIRRQLLDTTTHVQLPGGQLIIEWSGKSEDSLYMTGPAEKVFDGQLVLY